MKDINWGLLLWMILFGVLLAMLTSCKTVQPTTIVRDSVRIEYRLDSVYILQHDSIFRDRWRAGDTVYITTEKWLTRYKDKVQVVHDTINSVQREQIVVTEKYVPKFYKSCTWCFWILLILIIGIIALRIWLRR